MDDGVVSVSESSVNESTGCQWVHNHRADVLILNLVWEWDEPRCKHITVLSIGSIKISIVRVECKCYFLSYHSSINTLSNLSDLT